MIIIENSSFFSFLLSSLLESFDSAGGGAVGYIRRTLFVQCMLCHSFQAQVLFQAGEPLR